jgi:hypothetical protein
MHILNMLTIDEWFYQKILDSSMMIHSHQHLVYKHCDWLMVYLSMLSKGLHWDMGSQSMFDMLGLHTLLNVITRSVYYIKLF